MKELSLQGKEPQSLAELVLSRRSQVGSVCLSV